MRFTPTLSLSRVDEIHTHPFIQSGWWDTHPPFHSVGLMRYTPTLSLSRVDEIHTHPFTQSGWWDTHPPFHSVGLMRYTPTLSLSWVDEIHTHPFTQSGWWDTHPPFHSVGLMKLEWAKACVCNLINTVCMMCLKVNIFSDREQYTFIGISLITQVNIHLLEYL